MKPIKKDVIIIGAGLTGLVTAFYLKKKGKEVLVIDKNTWYGGAIRTWSENGYTFESGPNTGTLSNYEIVELFEDLSGCKLQVAKKEAYKRLILKKGVLHALPSGFYSAVTTPLFTLKDKFRILLEPWRKRGIDPDESVAALTSRRLGKSFLDYCVDPFISGIYAGNPERLITRYAMPKLYRLEQNYGSFVRGAIKKAKEPKTERDRKVSKQVFSVEGGLGNLVDSLVGEIGKDNIILGEKAEVSGSQNNWYISSLSGSYITSGIISTVGAHALPEVFPFVPSGLMDRLNNLEYARVVQVSVGLSTVKNIDFHAFGALIPHLENRNILGVLYPSACFDGRCSSDKVILSVFMGGTKHPGLIDLPDEELKKMVIDELEAVYHFMPAPDYIKVFKHHHAIPQYGKNTGERLEAIDEFHRLYPGIMLAGNMRNGIGMADRVKQAVDIANSYP